MFGDLNTEQPFGYRDIYQTPPSLLYQDLDQDNIPASQRHYDWQMFGENVTPQLKPVQPWQPQPVSKAKLADFPLKPPARKKLPSGPKVASGSKNVPSANVASGSKDAQPRAPVIPKPAATRLVPKPAATRLVPKPAATRVEPKSAATWVPPRPATRAEPKSAATRVEKPKASASQSSHKPREPPAQSTQPRKPAKSKSKPSMPGPPSMPKVLASSGFHGLHPTNDLREYSYANPLDVRTLKALPINAPPVDSLLNLGYDSVPVVSLSVLTPTEMRRQQRDYHTLRNLLLSRVEKCPHEGCGAVFPAGTDWLQKHIADQHTAEKCNFCSEPLFQHWTPDQRYQHFLSKHAKALRALAPKETDDHVEWANQKRSDRTREGLWKFCARCGRDHGVLTAPADRTHHDSVCYPDVQDQEGDWWACSGCGEHLDTRPGDLGKHACKGGADGEKLFCARCAFTLGPLSQAYKYRHFSFCTGHGRDNAKFCPWCGIEQDGDFDARVEHIEHCDRKPYPEALGPIDTASRSYFSSTATAPAEGRPQKRRKTTHAKEAQPKNAAPKAAAPKDASASAQKKKK